RTIPPKPHRCRVFRRFRVGRSKSGSTQELPPSARAEADEVRVSERLLTAAELAEMLGFAAGTIVDWAERGTIPAFKIGGRLRFRESEVLDWLEAQRVGPGKERSAVSPTPSIHPAHRVVSRPSPTS